MILGIVVAWQFFISPTASHPLSRIGTFRWNVAYDESCIFTCPNIRFGGSHAPHPNISVKVNVNNTII
jgi:hypothetical protein